MQQRILMLAGSYYPQIGGGESLNARHAQLLRAANFDVKVLVAGGTPGPGIDPLGTPYERVRAWNAAGFAAIPPARIAAEIDALKPSLLYCAGPEPHDAYARRIAARRGLRSALLYHADFRSDRAPSRLATAAYAALAASRFDAVLTTTHAYRARLIARGLDGSRVVCAGMGVDLNFFTPPSAYEPRERPRVLFVGRLDSQHTYKRLDLLLEALRDLADRGVAVDATIVGDGDRREYFESAARGLGLQRVVFRGQIVDERLRDAYREADVLVLPSPSASEGFGMVVLEAYACGCPAVVHRAAGSSEVVEASGCGAVWDGTQPAALARAIERAAGEPARRAQLGERARAYVESAHSWALVGERLAGALAPLARQEPSAQ